MCSKLLKHLMLQKRWEKCFEIFFVTYYPIDYDNCWCEVAEEGDDCLCKLQMKEYKEFLRPEVEELGRELAKETFYVFSEPNANKRIKFKDYLLFKKFVMYVNLCQKNMFEHPKRYCQELMNAELVLTNGIIEIPVEQTLGEFINHFHSMSAQLEFQYTPGVDEYREFINAYESQIERYFCGCSTCNYQKIEHPATVRRCTYFHSFTR